MLKLILPIIFPSWRFFSSIGPSPRIEMGFAVDSQSEPQEWLPFFLLPKKVNFITGLQRLFHNPVWNDFLYINTCAENLFEGYSEFHEREIGMRLVDAVLNGNISINGKFNYLRFRIRALEASAGKVNDGVVFISRAFSLRVKGS